MGSASIHRAGNTERVQFTVAELLARDGGGSGRVGSGRVESVPAGWPSGAGSVRRRLATAAGTVVVAGTFAAGAVLNPQPTYGGGPMGAETAGAGHPVGATPRAPRPRTVAAEPPRRAVTPVTPVARVVPVRPAARKPERRPTPKVVPREELEELPRTRDVPDDGSVRAPAGSALSGLTPAIGPVDALDSLLGGLGR